MESWVKNVYLIRIRSGSGYAATINGHDYEIQPKEATDDDLALIGIELGPTLFRATERTTFHGKGMQGDVSNSTLTCHKEQATLAPSTHQPMAVASNEPATKACIADLMANMDARLKGNQGQLQLIRRDCTEQPAAVLCQDKKYRSYREAHGPDAPIANGFG